MGGVTGGMMDGECCPKKSITGPNNGMNGVYTFVETRPKNTLPSKCNSPCVYKKEGSTDKMEYCFADSMTHQSKCDDVGDDAPPFSTTYEPDDKETPVNMDGYTTSPGGEDPVSMDVGPEGTPPINPGRQTITRQEIYPK